MMKTYIDYMDEITPDELYKGLVGSGLFAEKLPPVFTSESFFDYCKNNNPTFRDKGRQYVYYENMRNVNIPRPLGIPTPMTYQKLCKYLADEWDDIRDYFRVKTSSQTHKCSRIHIRKMYGTDKLFQMNYSDWRKDGAPENKIIYGKKYVVHADISKCFPSIYTHSLSWALAGKATAKQNKNNKNLWYNRIDHLTQITKDMETHGLIIGPHALNVLSEIILCAVDEKMVQLGWNYIRNIDDYTCYVESEEKAEEFLIDLQNELREYDLSLNHKKTKVSRLPNAMVEQWVRRIKAISLLTSYGKVDYKNCQTYLDYAIEIADKEKGNASVLNFAIKTLSGMPLTENAKQYEKDIVFHLCVLYPYLVTILDDYVFGKCNASVDEIKAISKTLFLNGMTQKLYEQASYAVYFSIKYNFDLPVNVDDVIATNDCILLAMADIYYKKKGSAADTKKLKAFAKTLVPITEDFERMWIFAYEALPESLLHEEWKTLKKAGITFIRSI
ncbi:RNA-directed DNA polymerase [Sharpea azabuensis]|uniref:RNA-directed DNA polymerase n=1 Tax=Sharpea azabuensis TaxID=322505 RepID=UPI003D0928C9